MSKRPKLKRRRTPTDEQPVVSESVNKFKQLSGQAEARRDEIRQYVKAGYSCFLFNHGPDGEKQSWPLNWKHLRVGRTSLNDIDRYIAKFTNVALVTSKTNNLLVVDCDTDHAVALVEEQLAPHIDLDTIPQAVGSKGRHFYFAFHDAFVDTKPKTDERECGGVQQRININGTGIDLVTNINAPPSINYRSGKPYKWLNKSIIEQSPPPMPEPFVEWLADHIKKHKKTKKTSTNRIDGKSYWPKTTTKKRNEVLFNSSLIDARKGENLETVLSKALKWAADHAGDDPMADAEIEKTVNSAFSYVQEEDMQKVEVRNDMNSKWVHVPHGRQVSFYRKGINARTGQVEYSIYGKEPFKDIHLIHPCPWNPKTTIADEWLRDPLHNMAFKGTVFEPGLDTGLIEYDDGNALNIWPGFTVNSIQDDDVFELFADWYVKAVLCCNDSTYANWLLNWLAYTVQHPDKSGGSAIVLIGPQATGKTTFQEVLRGLFGSASFNFSQAGMITGRFLSHLRTVCICNFDDAPFECFTHDQLSLLRAMITGEVLTIEPKFQEVIKDIPSYLHLTFTSNFNFTIGINPFGLERRFFIIEPDVEYQNDNLKHPYYKRNKKLWNEFYAKVMTVKGLSAVLHGLQNRELGDFDPKPALETKWLRSEKKAQAGHIKVFLDEHINELKGGLDVTDLLAKDNSEGDSYQTGYYYDRDKFFNYYRKWCKNNSDLITKSDPMHKSTAALAKPLLALGIKANEPGGRTKDGGYTWFLKQTYIESKWKRGK